MVQGVPPRLGCVHPVAMTFDHRPGTNKINDLATLARSGCTGLFISTPSNFESRAIHLIATA